MARDRGYIEADVYTEAKRRIHHCYDLHDSLLVRFSGGKDSLALLHLTREVALERGLTHVDVAFLDEELIPQVVIDFVDSYRRLPWVRMLYYCYPLRSTKYILGATHDYVQWDPARTHIRKMPDYALRSDKVHDQYTIDGDLAARFPGKLALLNGIRATESIYRFQSCMRKMNDNYINAGTPASTSKCKPIFDWEVNDVFRYFYEKKIAYCTQYDRQMFAGANMRVATPLHAEAAKRFHQLRTIDPVLYEQVISMFPEMLAHERYYRDLPKASAAVDVTMESVEVWIRENITSPGQRTLALKNLEGINKMRRNDAGGYPPYKVLLHFMRGGFKRPMLSGK